MPTNAMASLQMLFQRPPSASLDSKDAFELWCWRRFLRVPWTARRWSCYQFLVQELAEMLNKT